VFDHHDDDDDDDDSIYILHTYGIISCHVLCADTKVW